MIDHIFGILMLILVLAILWVVLKFLLKITLKLFSCGCLAILLLGGVLALLSYLNIF